jgi:hypothetical protein
MAEALIAGGAKVAIAARSSRVFDAAQEMGAIPLQMDLADRGQALALAGNADREPLILSRIPAGRWGQPGDLKGTVISGLGRFGLCPRCAHPRGRRLPWPLGRSL